MKFKSLLSLEDEAGPIQILSPERMPDQPARRTGGLPLPPQSRSASTQKRIADSCNLQIYVYAVTR